MKQFAIYFSISFFVSILLGCAAVGVPATSDPAKKLGWAYELTEKEHRPIPAERLIREAIEIYQDRHDDLGLAEGFRIYGIFFKSDSISIDIWWQNYFDNGFLDKTATVENRLDKSIEYFNKSKELFMRFQSYDNVSNIDWNLAFVYEAKGEREQACKFLESSLANNVKFVAAHPDTKIELHGNKSFGEVIVGAKRRMHCADSTSSS